MHHLWQLKKKNQMVNCDALEALCVTLFPWDETLVGLNTYRIPCRPNYNWASLKVHDGKYAKDIVTSKTRILIPVFHQLHYSPLDVNMHGNRYHPSPRQFGTQWSSKYVRKWVIVRNGDEHGAGFSGEKRLEQSTRNAGCGAASKFVDTGQRQRRGDKYLSHTRIPLHEHDHAAWTSDTIERQWGEHDNVKKHVWDTHESNRVRDVET